MISKVPVVKKNIKFLYKLVKNSSVCIIFKFEIGPFFHSPLTFTNFIQVYIYIYIYKQLVLLIHLGLQYLELKLSL